MEESSYEEKEIKKMSKKKRNVILISLGVTAFVTIIVALYSLSINVSGKLTEYKFAVSKEENPDYFKGEYLEKGLNPKTLFHDDYSYLTEIILNNDDNEEIDVIKVEHAVQVNDVDLIRLPELEDYNYLFSAVEIPNGEDIVSINVQNDYKGSELEQFGTYLFIYETDEDGHPNYYEPKIKDISNNPNTIKESGHFLYVKIYKFPKLQSNFIFKNVVPKGKWFTNEIVQQVEIIQENSSGEKTISEYAFELHWVKWWTIWHDIITIT